MTAEVFHFSKYAVLELDQSFADVKEVHWATAAIKSLAAKHIVTGISAAQFCAAGKCNPCGIRGHAGPCAWR